MRTGIYTVNTNAQTVAAGGTIALGAVERRYGCNCKLTSAGIVCDGQGYYNLDASITGTTSDDGTVILTAYKNGNAIPGATASQTIAETTGGTFSLSVTGMFKKCCPCCDSDAVITLGLSGNAASVTNVAARVTGE